MTASKDYNKNINDGSSMVSDALMVRQATLFELDTFLKQKNTCQYITTIRLRVCSLL